MAQPVLGILTLYLNENKALEERPIYQRMIVAGKKMGLDVFVFTPADVDYETNRIQAMVYDPSSKTWSRRWSSFPHMIFDRCRIQKSYRFEQLQKFRARYGHLTFLNRMLRNKWTVYKTLASQSRFQNRQPLTVLYTGHKDLADMLRRFPLVFLKPINGTGGRGILRIERQKEGVYLIQGRDQSRRIIRPQKVNAAALQERLSSWNLGGGKYIVQQGILIKLPSGRVHDYRLLVQKNGRGEWEPTGCAGRVGAAGSITSNLHGGGKAMRMEELLSSWVGDEELAAAVRREAEQFGVDVAAHLERQYGRLCELALDLAIDRKGGIWLLEVNPKPAREVFRQSGDLATYERAIVKPLEYAMYIYSRRGRKSGGRTAGSRTKGSRTAGSRTAGSKTAGSSLAGSEAAESRTSGSRPAEKPSAPGSASKRRNAEAASPAGGSAAPARKPKPAAGAGQGTKQPPAAGQGDRDSAARPRKPRPLAGSGPFAASKPTIRSVQLPTGASSPSSEALDRMPDASEEAPPRPFDFAGERPAEPRNDAEKAAAHPRAAAGEAPQGGSHAAAPGPESADV
ncbi:YheC/YheD family protein [Paenibacillus albicereus]|uniref:YheC/YheD family protein n=1 Tax=Paenibacillus albicereus TaxID=2726185 RepID=A0A6H2H019_9BACL|nr:YheC/YheD family protein [Paenibacillus albicereus]QJC53034.1 YheC/YheD family protein [Paenibacillus albicereus]